MDVRSFSPSGDRYFSHNQPRDWTAKTVSSSVEGTLSKAPRRTQEYYAPVGDSESCFVGDGVSSETLIVHKSPPRTKFATMARFPEYRGRTVPLAHSPLPNMACDPVSTLGTFRLKEDRDTSEYTYSTPGPYYDIKNDMATTTLKKNTCAFHSRGRRFAPLVDPEDAPGPIYFPQSLASIRGGAQVYASRFNYDKRKPEDDEPGPGAYNTNPIPTKIIRKIGGGAPAKTQDLEATCSFGMRTKTPLDFARKARTPGPGDYNPQVLSRGPAAAIPPPPDIETPRGTKSRNKPNTSSSSSTNAASAAVKVIRPLTYDSDTPAYGFATLPRDLPISVTPGPGDYHVEKFRNKNKPVSSTFSRDVHECAKPTRRFSPGPSSYFPDKLPSKTNFNKPCPGAPRRWR
eukprot:PhM_4_TR4128/c1_g1_i1/m.18303